MNKTKKNTVVMIISIFLFVALVALLIYMSQVDKLTNDTTTLYTATVDRVDVVDTVANMHVEIYTEEYDTYLLILTNISKNLMMDDVRNLQKGQTIYFRIENIDVSLMNNVEFLDITSLETDTGDIFSLDEYNKYLHDSLYSSRIAAVIMALLSLFVFIFGCFKRKRLKTRGSSPVLSEKT